MKKIGIEIKWGILFVVIQLLWMLGERLAGLHDENIELHAKVTNFFALIAIIIYVVALLDKRKNDLGGKMSWKQGFISGLIITAVVTLLTPLSQYLTSAVITPNHFENMISYTVETGNKTQEAAEAYFNLKNYMIQSIIFAPVVGIVTSAIVAIFTRKK
jgi:NADH:ubiquinone oxidoreductase subunit 3 (subunit A)